MDDFKLNTIEEENPEVERVGYSKKYLNQALGDLRSLSKTLHGENILKAGLAEALEFELKRVNTTGYLKTQLNNRIKNWSLAPQSEVIIFRIFQHLLYYQKTIKRTNEQIV